MVLALLSLFGLSVDFNACDPKGDFPVVSVKSLKQDPYKYEGKVVQVSGRLSIYEDACYVNDSEEEIVIKRGDDVTACSSYPICKDNNFENLDNIKFEQSYLLDLFPDKYPKRYYEVSLLGVVCLRKDKDGQITTMISPATRRYPIEFIFFKVVKIEEVGEKETGLDKY